MNKAQSDYYHAIKLCLSLDDNYRARLEKKLLAELEKNLSFEEIKNTRQQFMKDRLEASRLNNAKLVEKVGGESKV